MNVKLSGNLCPSSNEELISSVYSIVRFSLTSKAKGFINLYQTIYLIQWAHSVFKLHDEHAGQTFTEKYLFYLKAEKYLQDDSLTNLEQLCNDGRAFLQKSQTLMLFQPSHSKMLATIYKMLGQMYLKNKKNAMAISVLEDAERTLILLLKKYPTYLKAKILLEAIQADLKSLYS